MTSITLREMLVKQEPRYVNYCYVCSGLRAEYTIFSKPYGDHPFFPFLEHHQPPDGSESMGPDGRVLVCLICYTFLNQQWDSYEKNKTPQNKRIYWLKRLDNGPFAGMDLNLQQDYEALFESSNAAGDNETRQKAKHSRSIQGNNLDASKPVIKFQEKHESSDSSSFQFQSEKVETQANNILDLSMPSRSLSQSSLSASPSSSSEVCYVCGQDSQSVINIFIKPIANCPFFPSLKSHIKPDNAKAMDVSGKVYACEKCHKSLIQQWDFYQKQNVPHNERVYQLNCQPVIPAKNDIPSKDRTFVCYICGMVTQLSIQRFIHGYPKTEGDSYFSFLLHLNPHPGANRLVDGKAAVCSVCYKSLSRQRRVYELSSVPEECRKYKVLNESTSDNYSVLRQHLKSGAENQTTDVKSECYLCDTVTESLFYVHTIPSSDMYFPFIRNLKHANVNLIDSQGRVRVCSQCHNSLCYQWEAFEHAHIPINQRQYKVSSLKLDQSEKYAVSSSQQCDSSAVLIVKEEEYNTRKLIRDVCTLCERQLSSDNVCVLDTQPQKEGVYFPSIELLVKSNRGKGTDQYGRVLACNQCYVVLKKQWDVFESAHVPHSQRQYEIYPPSQDKEQVSHFASNIQLAEASNALHIQVSSPDLKFDLSKHSVNSEPLLTTVNTVPVANITMSNAHIVNSSNSPLTVDHKTPPSKSNSEEPPAPKISGPLDVPYVRPLLLMPITCFICGEYNSSGLTYAIKSVPKLSEDVPFFPFLTKHPIPESAEKLTNDGSALACMFCYHSMVSQWLAYESSPFPEDGNRWTRHYNSHNYVCFICGITTYRKRVCSISVRDFPFLVEHTRPPGALTLLNGECVVTCLMCFESVTSQWKDFERMKVPVEMRKYNWIVMPPPPDDENSRGCQILSGQESSATTVALNETEQSTLDESGLPHGLKPSTSHMPVPVPYGLVKPVNRSLVSPAHQAGGAQAHAGMGFSPFAGNANPSALNATRTSSFAAALRKLAKQAIDPIPDKELSPVSPASSPALSQQSGHSRHHSSLPMYLSRHSNASPMSHSSSPIVTTTPVHNSNMQGKGMDLGRYSSNGRSSANNPMEPVSLKVENSKTSNACNEKRLDSGQSAKQFAPSNLQMGLRQEHSASLRGFQPYRNLEDHHGGPPQMYNSSSPPPSNAERYSYHHPAFVQSSHVPPHSYRRLEDPVYLERYGLLRPTVMPYPPSSSSVLTNRAPLYSSSHYPPELLTQSGRPLSSNNESYTPRFASEEESVSDNTMRKREMELYRERERYLESEEGRREREIEYLRHERSTMSQSPISRSYASGRAEATSEDKERIGSIIHGTPRDLVLRRLSPPSSAVPLNLATTVNHAEEHIKKEEFEHASNRHHYSTSNGLPMHSGFRKDENVSSYQIVRQSNLESDQKRSHDPEASESSAPLPPKFASYYSEREFHKSPVVETRTLTMSSVINSQINGIFSREKFTNPNPYEFPGSIGMGTEKNLSEGHNKGKSESKSLYIAQDNYPGEFSRSTDRTSEDTTGKGLSDVHSPHGSYSHSMSHRDRMHLQESSESKGKLMSFSAADQHHSYDENHLSYKGRPPSLTKALLQSNMAPSVLEHYMNIGKEYPPKVVSVLDEREAKARKSRLKGVPEESEDSEVDSDEETALRIKRCLTIVKDPTRKLELEPKKIKFLSKVGLLTHSKKQTFELQKFIQRHKILREKSCSPVIEEPIKEAPLHYDLNHLSELSKRLCVEENCSSKKDFLHILHLEPLTEDQKIEREETSKLIIDEKARRNGQLKPSQRCLELQGFPSRKRGYSILHGLKHNSSKKSNMNDFDDNVDCDVIRGQKNVQRKNMSFTKIIKSDVVPERRLSAFLKPPMRTVTLPVPPLIPTPQAMSISENASDKNSAMVPLHRVKHLNKDFVQEFHNSVLQSTQMKLAVEKVSPVKKSGDVSSDQIPDGKVKESMDCSPDFYPPRFRWPGIEAIMESYECHISEQSNEKIFLTKSCQNLKAAVQQSNSEMECLEQKRKEFIQEKHKLEQERETLQGAIDNFKSFIQRHR